MHTKTVIVIEQIPSTSIAVDLEGEKTMMTVTESENGSKGWKKFLMKHWKMTAVFAVVAVLAGVSAVLVLLWFIGNAQSTGMVPTTLGLWTMGNMVTFLLHLIFWEVLIIGIPVIIAAVAGWLWWKRLPEEEKKEHNFSGKRSRSTSGGGGAVSLLVWIGFLIKVYTDGNWNVAVATWTLDYLVSSFLSVLMWIIIIFGIPGIVIGLIWWIANKKGKSSTVFLEDT